MIASQPSPFYDEVPTDFVAHLEQRLGLEQGDVVTTLAGWVIGYQPGPAALALAQTAFD
jgi:hypothetical protein